MVGKNTRRTITLVSAILTIVGSVIAYKITASLSGSRNLAIVGAWVVAGIIVTYLLSRLQARSQEESPEAIKDRVSQLEPELRKQVQARSYGARSNLIEAPLRELDLDITPRLGWVRDPRLVEPEPASEKVADDIVAAFEFSKRRMLIVGEPGSGKTIAAYSLIEYLDNTEGDQRLPLLVNLSAWEAQDNFEAFLVDYLCSSVGYEVRERAVASAFIDSDRYSLILDGLDEIPLRLRLHFSERLDEFVRGLPGEVGVVVTCRTQEYEEMLDAHPRGLGLVQAVEILPLSSEQLDSAFVELAKFDKDWETFLSQRHLRAYQRVRDLLSNPLFLNLAVVGRLSPDQLLDWTTTEHELRDLVLDRYLDRTLANQSQYAPADARRYLSWIACFLNGEEVSPFGLKETDFTVFDLADLTPPDPPRLYRVFGLLAFGLFFGLVLGLSGGLSPGQGVMDGLGLDVGQVWGLVLALVFTLIQALVLAVVFGLIFGLVFALVFGRVWEPFKRSALSSRLTLVWPSTRRQLLNFLRRAGRGVGLGLVVGLVFGLVMGLFIALIDRLVPAGVDFIVSGLGLGPLAAALASGLVMGLGFGLVMGLVMGLGFGLLEPGSVLITSRTPKEASSRSLIAALTWLASGLVMGLILALVSVVWGLPSSDPGFGLGFGLGLGLILALRNGGWFVLLQKVAHRRLARAGNLPPRPYDFLEWGIETQVFRRVGGGVRFRHNLIQRNLAKSQPQQPHEAEVRSETRGPKLALVGVFLALTVLATARYLWGTNLNEDYVYILASVLGLLVGLAIGDLLTLAVIMLVVSGVGYLFFMRRQGVTFREAIFNWPMVGVAGVVALLLLFTNLSFVSLLSNI